MKADELLLVLIEARKALEKANEDGPICDTICMPGRPETLFDFLDVAIEKALSAGARNESQERAAHVFCQARGNEECLAFSMCNVFNKCVRAA